MNDKILHIDIKKTVICKKEYSNFDNFLGVLIKINKHAVKAGPAIQVEEN